MTITPAASAVSAQKTVAAALPEARETGPDHDGDADDAGGKISAAAVAPVPTVNPLGQITGSSISTKA